MRNWINPFLAFLLDAKDHTFLNTVFIRGYEYYGKLGACLMCHLTNYDKHLLAKNDISSAPVYSDIRCLSSVCISGEFES